MSSENEKSQFLLLVEEIFGQSLAQKIRPEDDIIEPKDIRHINERAIHPLILPVYESLISKRLSVRAWVVIYHRILLCKIYKRQIPHLYHNIYENLTKTSVRGSIFDVIPIEEKQIWYENYTSELETKEDKVKLFEHSKFCLQQAQEIVQFCEQALKIEVPKLDITEYLRQLNILELSISQELDKQKPSSSGNTIDQTLPLHEEINSLEQYLEESFRDITSQTDLIGRQNKKQEVPSYSSHEQNKERKSDQGAVTFPASNSKFQFTNDDKLPESRYSYVRSPPYNPKFDKSSTPSCNIKSKFFDTKTSKNVTQTNKHSQAATAFNTSPINSKLQETEMANQIRIIDFMPKKLAK